MSSQQDDIESSKALLEGKLVVGNHDTITLFCAKTQTKLRDYSKSISRIIINDHDELNLAIENVVKELDLFEATLSKRKSVVTSIFFRKKSLQREYSRIVAYIECASNFLKLQKAQLLKEEKLLEGLENAILSTNDSLEKNISEAKLLLSEYHKGDISKRLSPPNILDSRNDNTLWYGRLERRIEDLSISHTLSQQSIAQIKILRENNLILIDKISSLLNNTFPVWQSQVAILIGLENLQKLLQGQEQLAPSKAVDIGKLSILNLSLRADLKETSQLENNDKIIRNEYNDTVQCAERG